MTTGTLWFGPVVSVVIGCGDVAGVSPDAGADAHSPVDVAVDGLSSCRSDAPFGAAVPVPGVNTASSEEAASLSLDELTIYITTVRGTGPANYDIWYATRPARDAGFGTAVRMNGINSASNEEGAVITADGLTLYVATNNTAVSAGGFDIATATRTSTTADFGPLSDVAGVNFSGGDEWPWIRPDGKELYFTSQGSSGAGNYHIYRATRTTGPFAAPSEVGELASNNNEGQPVVAADGLSIFFSSDRPGGSGDAIWLATRTTAGDGFGTPMLIPELDTASSEWPVWLSPDNCRLYFGSSRPGDGSYDLWVASR